VHEAISQTLNARNAVDCYARNYCLHWASRLLLANATACFPAIFAELNVGALIATATAFLLADSPRTAARATGGSAVTTIFIVIHNYIIPSQKAIKIKTAPLVEAVGSVTNRVYQKDEKRSQYFYFIFFES
jgi:hypothetical protein